MTSESEYSKNLLDSLYEGLYFVDDQRRITFWNRAAERISGYAKEEVLGISCAQDILVHVDESGRPLCEQGCPLHATLTDGEQREVGIFLKHRHGHRVPVKVKVSPVRNEQGEVEGAVELFTDNSALLELVQRLRDAEERARLDALTGLPNRGFLDEALASHVDALDRFGWGFGLLIMDIDHLARLNDSLGRDLGDEAVKLVARTLEHNLRGIDLLGRWGDEAFLVLLPGASLSSMRRAGERLRVLVERSCLVHHEQRLAVTISIGCALARRGEGVASSVQRAAQAIERAKRSGRNRVELHEPLELLDADGA